MHVEKATQRWQTLWFTHADEDNLRQENEKQSYKSAGVVVPQSLGVAEGLQQRVGLQDDVFDVLRGNRGNELLAASLTDCKTR